MRTKEMLVALSMVLIAAPAAAAGAEGKENAAKPAVAAQAKKYCIAYDNIVGSRVTRQECKTKADWAKEGVDVDKLLKE